MDDKRARFEGQVLPHLDAAYRFARWLCRSGDADDVVQDALLRAFRGFDALRGSDAKAWLLTIVRNCHSTALRQRRQHVSMPLPDEHALDGHEMLAHELISTVPGPEQAASQRDEARTLDRLLS